MIFICVGSREYQFDRLLQELDLLVKKGAIKDTIFGQIGQSNYLPEYFAWKRFVSAEEFKKYQHDSDLVISHGGTGALIGALKMGKKVISVPRLAKYGEHIDDHQTQVSGMLAEEGYLWSVLDIDDLYNTIQLAKNTTSFKTYNKPSQVLSIIEEFIGN